MVFSFRLLATPALAKRRGRFHLPLFQLTAWAPPPDASRYCMSLNAIAGGAGMRQIQPVIHGNARRAGLHLSITPALANPPSRNNDNTAATAWRGPGASNP